MKYCPAPSASCDLCTCNIWSSYIQRLRSRCIYKNIQYLTWPFGQGHMRCCQLPSTSSDLCTCKVATSSGLGGDAFTRKYIIWPWVKISQFIPVPSTSCDLCSCKVWSLQFRSKCIYKKIHYLTFDPRSRLHNAAQYSLHRVAYVQLKVVTSSRLGGDAFTRKYIDLWVKVAWNKAQYPLHHVTYAATKFEVATSNSLGGDTFTRKVRDRRTTERLWYKINIPSFS